MLTPDSPVARRRTLAAMANHLADYNAERLNRMFTACGELGCVIPPKVATIPEDLRRWSASLQRGR